ncbi:MAG TPA: prepilin-type N-terminal cleavage/methylation domain-containing protein [Gemmatimonadota bacterium]|nr:prepilin-type N-terminal cleavage/methylation domain-containing protein [Gemmatimonadota bacterium]
MNAKGFTLLEALIVITILSILSAIASASVKSAKDSAYMAVLVTDLEQLAIAQEVYYAERAGYFGQSDGGEGTYTSKINKLDFTPSPNVRIKVRADEGGWSARADHANRRSDQFYCAVFVGSAEAYEPATAEGVIACSPRRK